MTLGDMGTQHQGFRLNCHLRHLNLQNRISFFKMNTHILWRIVSAWPCRRRNHLIICFSCTLELLVVLQLTLVCLFIHQCELPFGFPKAMPWFIWGFDILCLWYYSCIWWWLLLGLCLFARTKLLSYSCELCALVSGTIGMYNRTWTVSSVVGTAILQYWNQLRNLVKQLLGSLVHKT